MTPKRTIRKDIHLSGVGVHSGKNVLLALKPSESGRILFRRSDLGNLESRLDASRAESLNSTAHIGEKFKVQTVEHLLAALFAFGIHSLVIELDADEVPILDGSALPFARALEQAGTRLLDQKIPFLKITKPFAVQEEDASIIVEPGAGNEVLWLTYSIEYSHPVIGIQSLSLPFRKDVFVRDIAPARTFGFHKDAEMLRARGLALGASFKNTVVLDDEKVMNGPLRFPDEFVRHKLLDLAGDLAFLGRPVIGRFIAHKAGHRLHLRVVKFLTKNPDFYEEK